MEPSDEEKETFGFLFKQSKTAADLPIPFHGNVADAIAIMAQMGNAALLAFLLKMVLKDRITDDEIQIRKGLRMKVNWEEEGFQIAGEASNGAEALEVLRDLDIDVVITDMRMPIMEMTTPPLTHFFSLGVRSLYASPMRCSLPTLIRRPCIFSLSPILCFFAIIVLSPS